MTRNNENRVRTENNLLVTFPIVLLVLLDFPFLHEKSSKQLYNVYDTWIQKHIKSASFHFPTLESFDIEAYEHIERKRFQVDDEKKTMM